MLKRDWHDDKKGLHKNVTLYKALPIVIANDLSKCCVAIRDISGLADYQESQYLRDVTNQNEYWITMMNAVTPIDCYIELILKHMVPGEESQCSIETKTGKSISFGMHLIRVEFGGYAHTKTANESYQLAQQYKEKGVQMYKKYPQFAQDYFNKAAKLLISYQPFDTLGERTEKLGEADPVLFQSLLETIQCNIAVCLINQQRYDDAVHVLKYTERVDNVPDKAIYRRAKAFYMLGKLDEARESIEHINYKEQPECLLLYQSICGKLEQSEETYRHMVRRMFR